MKKALLTTILLCAVTTAASAQYQLWEVTRESDGLNGPVHIVQYAWYCDNTGDGYGIDNTSTQIYDTAGRLVYKLEMSSDGLDDDIYYTYDSQGRITSLTLTKREPCVITYHHAANGRLESIDKNYIGDSEYDGSLKVLKYDSQGRSVLVEWDSVNAGTYLYYPNGRLKQVTVFYRNELLYHQYYNEHGQIDSTITYAQISKCYYYRYNDKNNLIAREIINNGHKQFAEDYTYDFIDDYGNWTERTIHRHNSDMKIFERRTIIYYE